MINLPDEELVKLFCEGNEDAFAEITKRYTQRLNAIARKYFLVGAGSDDLMQEAMIGLYSACLSFKNKSGNMSFKNFATLCVTRRIQQAVKIANRDKNKAFMSYMSIDSQGKLVVGQKNDDDETEEAGFYICTDEMSPEQSIVSSEKVKEILQGVNNKLSSFEKSVLKIYIEGYNYIEIAKKLKKEPKSIDNALNRIKIKLKYLRN